MEDYSPIMRVKVEDKIIQGDFTTLLKLTLASHKCSFLTRQENKEQMWFENHSSVLTPKKSNKKKRRRTHMCSPYTYTSLWCGILPCYCKPAPFESVEEISSSASALIDMCLILFPVILLWKFLTSIKPKQTRPNCQKYLNKIHIIFSKFQSGQHLIC